MLGHILCPSFSSSTTHFCRFGLEALAFCGITFGVYKAAGIISFVLSRYAVRIRVRLRDSDVIDCASADFSDVFATLRLRLTFDYARALIRPGRTRHFALVQVVSSA